MSVRVLTVLLGVTAAAQNLNLYSKEKEAALGARLAEEVRRRSKALDSDAARRFVERIGRELAPEAKQPSPERRPIAWPMPRPGTGPGSPRGANR
jgi:hypothetical protein